MGETKHTPGPWRTTKRNPRTVCNAGGDKYLAKALVGSAKTPSQRFILDHDVAEANARLIAAAPDLLEALRSAAELAEVACGMTGCRSDDDFVWGVQKKIRAAIAKSERRSND